MDVVYILAPGEANEELRYSLRSLGNLEHDRVWIVGSKPSWVTKVEFIPTDNVRKTKYENSTDNVLAACAHPGISESFVLMNDDFYILDPMDEIPTRHRGRVEMVMAYYEEKYGIEASHRQAYMQGMRQTWALLESWGFHDPLSYETHIPMVIRKDVFSEAVLRARREAEIVALHKRTLYGNVAGVGGEFYSDPKVIDSEMPWSMYLDDGFLSTNANTFSMVEQFLKERFPTKSVHEIA